MNSTAREYNMVVDSLGIDPLLDPRNQQIRDIVNFQSIILSQQYEDRPDLLAFDYYSEVELWWILFIYNGFTSISDFKSGINLKLPNPQDVFDALRTVQQQQVGKVTL